VLLGDFGIARALDDAKLTATGSFMATVSYAAPEVLAGLPFDGRADLYSLGCTFFRFLTGEPPFPSTNGMAAVMAAHLQAPPPRVSDRVPGLSARMDAVIAKAMAKDPAARFASAREFAAAAAEAMRGEDTVASRPVPGAAVAPYMPEALPPAGGTRPWQQHGARVSYPLSGPGPVPPAPYQGSFGPPPRPRRARWIAAVAALVVVAAVAVGVTLTVRSRHDAAPAAQATSSAPISTTRPTVAPSGLLGLLLAPEPAAEIMGAPDMRVTASLNAIHDDSSWTIVDKDCLGPFLPAQRVVYADTGWRGAQEQGLQASSGGMAFTQAVISYPSAEAARKVVAQQEPQWAACSGRTIAVHVPDKPDAHFTFGPLINTDGALSMVQTSTDFSTNNVGCQRALAARHNVVIDIGVCRPDLTNQGVDVLNAIAGKIPK
jgi:serine/threonine-protein kinase